MPGVRWVSPVCVFVSSLLSLIFFVRIPVYRPPLRWLVALYSFASVSTVYFRSLRFKYTMSGLTHTYALIFPGKTGGRESWPVDSLGYRATIPFVFFGSRASYHGDSLSAPTCPAASTIQTLLA